MNFLKTALLRQSTSLFSPAQLSTKGFVVSAFLARRLLVAATPLALVASLALAGPAAADTSDGLTYSADSNQVTITGCDGPCPSSLVIPEKIDGKPVVAIAEEAFAEREGITSVVLPEGLTSIGVAAFSGVTGIASVTVPSTVTSLGRAAFQSMSALTSATFAEGSQISEIPNDLFREDYSLKNVTLPATVTSIGGAAFLNDRSLATLTFKGDAPTIGENAFLDTGAVAHLATKSLAGYGYNGDDFHGLTVTGGYSRPGTPGSFSAEPALASNPLSTTVDFTLAEAGGTVECRINDGEWGDCTSVDGTAGKFTVSNLTGGEQSISVRQTNSDEVPSKVGTVYLAPKLIDAPVGLVTKGGVQFQLAHASRGELWCEVNTPASYINFRPCANISPEFFAYLRIKITPGESVDGVATDTVTTCSPNCFFEDGTNRLSFKQVIDGKESLVARVDWNEDRTGPSPTVITSKPDVFTNSRSASIGFHVDEANSTFECSLDDAAFSACTSPKALSDLTDGYHTLKVHAVDALGNAGDNNQTSWTVDTVAPAAPTVASPASASTFTGEVPFNASGEQGAKLMCSLDGGEFVKCPAAKASPGDQGTISVGWHTRLHWGESPGWARLYWGVAFPPSGMLPDGELNWVNEQSAADLHDGVTPAEIWRVDGTNGSCADFYDYWGQGSSMLVGIPGEGSAPTVYNRFEIDCSSTLAEVGPGSPAIFAGLSQGQHTLSVKQVDRAGNESPAVNSTWNVGSGKAVSSKPVISSVRIAGRGRVVQGSKNAALSLSSNVAGSSVVRIIRNGKTVKSVSGRIRAGKNTLHIPTRRLKPGRYQVRITINPNPLPTAAALSRRQLKSSSVTISLRLVIVAKARFTG